VKKAKVNFLEAVALDAYVKLMRAAESVTTRAHVVLPDGLTITQFGALEVLYHSGPMSPTQIAGKLLKSAGNITLVLDNLERGGWVKRERKHDDRRHVIVSLTNVGHDHIAKVFPSLAASMNREFSVLSQPEQLELARICRKLGLGAHIATSPSIEDSPTSLSKNDGPRSDIPLNTQL
jgi:MarR family transcriptional regulator, 2-MHQ and catechol-resistance regulon repressor